MVQNSSKGTPLTCEDAIVVKLDRGFPLVRLVGNKKLIRCEHSTALVKGQRGQKERAVIGDMVQVSVPEGHDKGIIEAIDTRQSAFIRKDPAERTVKQVLAANFNLVIIAEPIVDLNRRRLERELVLAHETGTKVAVVLTKTDMVSPQERNCITQEIRDLAGPNVKVLTTSLKDVSSIDRLRTEIPPDTVAILIGKSGVGKSSLVNALAGETLQNTTSVRQADGKGRHTTVDRVLIDIPSGGAIVDMPGVRGLGLWDADQGLNRAFADIEELAAQCHFRDCSHTDEPGCAVLEAVEQGKCAETRLDSYRSLAAEIEKVRTQRDEARHRRGEKASDRKSKRRK